jgi:hypothetical protein
LAIVIVTFPALADSVLVLKASFPLGSAVSLRELPPPELDPPLLAGVLVAGVVAAVVFAAGAGVEPALVEVPDPPPPHPATERAAAVAPRTSNIGVRININLPDRVIAVDAKSFQVLPWEETVRPVREARCARAIGLPGCGL